MKTYLLSFTPLVTSLILQVWDLYSGAETSFEQRRSYLEWNFDRRGACWLSEVRYLESVAYTLFWYFTKMSQGLRVEYRMDKERYIHMISLGGCEYVDDFIKKIKDHTQFSSTKDFEVTLYEHSGTYISPADHPSLFVSGNSFTNPHRIEASIPFPVAFRANFDVELTSFWKSSREISNQNSFLIPSIRPYFFPTLMKGIYVQRAYADLFTIICNNLNPGNLEKQIHRMAITGTPGTGKSVFYFISYGGWPI